jgi:hypothetical protein
MPGNLVLAEGDPDRLHQVVAGLLADARTHTPPELLPRVFERLPAATPPAPGPPAATAPHGGSA